MSISSKISTDNEIDEILKEMGKNETKFKNRSLINKIKSFDNTKRLSNNVDVFNFWHNFPDEVLKFILGDMWGNFNKDLLEHILLINLN